MKNRRITLIVAVVLAVATGFATLRYLSAINKKAEVSQQAVELRSIVIANRDIPARSKITASMLTKVTRQISLVEPQAISEPKQAEGDVALISLPQGSTLTATKIGQPAEVGLTARLKPGQRAVSIPVDRVKSVSGLIQTGDRVDVLASVGRGAGVAPKTYTIIRGAMVLAINATLETAGASPSPDNSGATTVTLGVSPEQADLLTVADINTTLRLALRSPQENVRSLPAERLQFADLGSVPGPAAAPANVAPPMQPAAAPVALVPAPHVGSGVIVIDGDRVTSGGR